MDSVKKGNESLQPVVLIHGWPDSTKLWDSMQADLESQYYTIALQLPNFTEEKTKPFCGFDELVFQSIKEIETILSKSSFDKVYLIGHDWGAYLSYRIEMERPDLIEKLVTMDVGAHLEVGQLDLHRLVGFRCAREFSGKIFW